MNLSLDNDMARKLAAFLLLNHLPRAFNGEPSTCYVLPTLKFQLRLKDAHKAKELLGSDAALYELTKFLADAQEILDIAPQAANLVLALDLDGIDPGEKTLLAWLLTERSHTMLTGDKRAICALGALSSKSSIVKNRARIQCLETVILKLIDSIGFRSVSAAVRGRPDVDIALRMAFGNSVAASEPAAKEGLASYIADLVTKSKGFYIAEHG